MIDIEAVTKRYGDATAVDGLSLRVGEGEVCVLVGPSGCGKTTTLRMINCLVEPTSGRIRVNGQDVTSVRPEELRRGLGYVIQSVGLFPHLTVLDNVITVPKLLGWDRGRMTQRAEELLLLVGLDPVAYAGKYPRHLSGGEAQRVGVARALAADPPVLLMDEPFGAVDPINRERLQGEFARIQRTLRKTVIFVTHDVDEAIRLADRVAVMRAGRLEQYATPEELLDRPANDFVREFVGTDRALKRLGRVRTSSVMRPDAPCAARGAGGAITGPDGCGDARFVYVVDAEGRLEGWLDRDGGTQPPRSTPIDWRESAVRPDASLREALSRMLGLGFRSIAVTDETGVLLGEIGLEDIERATDGADSHLGAGGHAPVDAPDGVADPPAANAVDGSAS